jgi:hypothetical protein
MEAITIIAAIDEIIGDTPKTSMPSVIPINSVINVKIFATTRSRRLNSPQNFPYLFHIISACPLCVTAPNLTVIS